jgi:hypothetical protein
MGIQPAPLPSEPIDANSVPWRRFFGNVNNLLGGLIAEQAQLANTTANIANSTSGLGVANHFVTLNANGDLQDAGASPSLVDLPHDHSNAAKGGSIAQPTWAGGGNFVTVAANSITVNDTGVTANSFIAVFAADANAAIQQYGNNALYEAVANRVPGTSFTLMTVSGNNMGAGHNYEYVRIG